MEINIPLNFLARFVSLMQSKTDVNYIYYIDSDPRKYSSATIYKEITNIMN